MSIAPRIPIRLKILVTMLFVVTLVVSAITFTMANLFHIDKKIYIRDMVQAIAVTTAEECRSSLVGYRERLQVFARIMSDESFSDEQKSSLVKGLFLDFQDLVSVTVYRGDEALVTAQNGSLLAAAAQTADDLKRERDPLLAAFREMATGDTLLRNTTSSPQLPVFTMAVATDPGEDPLVVAGVILLDPLMQLAGRESAFEVFIADGTGALLAHPDPSQVAGREPIELDAAAQRVRDQRSLAMAFETKRGDMEVIAGYANVDLDDIIVGVEIPKTAAFLASRDLLIRLLYVAFGLLLLAALIGLFWARRLTRPVEKLSAATREIAKGQFDLHLEVDSNDEMGDLATSFNSMAGELDERERKLHAAQAQLVQSEKMAAFGQLGAGIAHEVKNPLAGILGCAQLALRKVEPDSSTEKNLKLIEKETKRCKAIIESLLRFARDEKAIMEPTALDRVIEDARAIVNHQLELNKVHLAVEIEENLPKIQGNANQLQQVLMNLMINAQQAMDGEPGTIRVAARALGPDHVEISVSDDGPGMNEEVRAKLFEPFFTTKPGGKGTGLGLSVSFGIVKEHRGEIEVQSSPGNGATFFLRLPTSASASVESVPA